MKSLFPEVDYGVRGGTQCNRGYIWFFKGRKVWSYHNGRIRHRFPRYVTDQNYPSYPYASINFNKKFYILDYYYAYRFDTDNLRIIDRRYPISRLFYGIPPFINSTLQLNGSIYFFKSNSVYKFNLSQQRVERGYPRPTKYEKLLKCI